MKDWLTGLLQNEFKQMQIKSGDREYTLLSGKKGNIRVNERKIQACKKADKQNLAHNRKKHIFYRKEYPSRF